MVRYDTNRPDWHEFLSRKRNPANLQRSSHGVKLPWIASGVLLFIQTGNCPVLELSILTVFNINHGYVEMLFLYQHDRTGSPTVSAGTVPYSPVPYCIIAIPAMSILLGRTRIITTTNQARRKERKEGKREERTNGAGLKAFNQKNTYLTLLPSLSPAIIPRG